MSTTTKERGILFNGEMVRAILDGRKTQTRRPVKPQPPEWAEQVHESGKQPGLWLAWEFAGDATHHSELGASPFGVPGDRLWVRETWFANDYRCTAPIPKAPPEDFNRERDLYFRADGEMFDQDGYGFEPGCHWEPSIHMPRWASRLTLEVKRVWVERVQEMTFIDKGREGLTERDDRLRALRWIELWDSIYGKQPSLSWEDNPWVWCCEFEVTK